MESWLPNSTPSGAPCTQPLPSARCSRALTQSSPIAMPCLSFPISKPAHCLLGEVSGSPEVRQGRALLGVDCRKDPKEPQKGFQRSLPQARSTILCLCPGVPPCTSFPVTWAVPAPNLHHPEGTLATFSQRPMSRWGEPPPGGTSFSWGTRKGAEVNWTGPSARAVPGWVTLRTLCQTKTGAWAQTRQCQMMDESEVTAGTDAAPLLHRWQPVRDQNQRPRLTGKGQDAARFCQTLLGWRQPACPGATVSLKAWGDLLAAELRRK